MKDTTLLFPRYLLILQGDAFSLQIYGGNVHFSSFASVTSSIVSPVLFDYTFWTLKESKKAGIKRLYFLARDGFILYHIALLINERYRMGIDCRYLHTSRVSSRIPAYHLMGKECMEFICEKKMYTTLRTILQNATTDKNEQECLYRICKNEQYQDLDKELNTEELQELKLYLLKNSEFMIQVYKISENAYKNILAYLKQEGLFDTVNSAFVDVGWRGTIQITLNKLLKKSIPAFYFGLYTTSFLTQANNSFYTYLFSSETDSKFVNCYFNNSLFECFCSAPSGMTVGYENINGKMKPLLSSDININSEKWVLDNQIELIILHVKKILDTFPVYTVNKKRTQKLLERIMRFPSKNEANIYGEYLFSDETNEEKLTPLAPPFSFIYIIYHSFMPHRLIHFLFNMLNIKVNSPKTYWSYGSLQRAQCPVMFKYWYRFYGFYQFYRKKYTKKIKVFFNAK